MEEICQQEEINFAGNPQLSERDALESLVREKWASFGLKERELAKYILRNREAIFEKPISQIAIESGVSKPSVTRFFKKLGYDGMKDFKSSFQRSLSHNCNAMKEIAWGDDASSVIGKIFAHAVSSLEDTLSSLSDEKMASVAKALSRASVLDVFGIGGSAIAAYFLTTEFQRLGIRALSHTDAYSIDHFSKTLLKNGTAVFFSRSGRTESILRLANEAKDGGAYTVAFTSDPSSPLASIVSDVVIVKKSDVFKEDKNSILSEVAVVSSLYYLAALEKAKENSEFRESYFEATNYRALENKDGSHVR